MIGANNTGCLIQNTQVYDNLCRYRGGGFYVDTNSACTIRDCTESDGIHGNKATEYGAGIYSNYAAPLISDCSIVENQLNGAGVQRGVGVAAFGGAVEVEGCTIEGNFTPAIDNAYGGGIWFSGGSGAVVSGNIIRDNSCGQTGGGVMVSGALADFLIRQ